MSVAAPSPDLLRLQRGLQVSRNPHLLGLARVSASRPTGTGRGAGRWRLTLEFLPSEVPGKPSVPASLSLDHVVLRPVGAVEVSGLRPVELARSEDRPDQLLLTVEPTGPAGETAIAYSLELVGVEGLDPFFSSATFRLGPELPRPSPREAPAEAVPEGPPIDYLAKDYASFRSLMLERMATALPDWEERNPVDLGVAVVEVLAYAADQLSYYQDAVGTEAYLGTARLRRSVRRHARLVDYVLSEGLNARAWLELEVDRATVVPMGTRVLSGDPEPRRIEPGSVEEQTAIDSGASVFATLEAIAAHPELDRIDLHAWAVSDYRLEAGATEAALVGHLDALSPGRFLLLMQSRDPVTGASIESHTRKVQVVRLTGVTLDEDPLSATPITRVAWSEEDALEFPLWVRRSSQEWILALAKGNVVLASHGFGVTELLPAVVEGAPYRPILERRPLSQSVPYLPARTAGRPARGLLAQDPSLALPEIFLLEIPEAETLPLAPVEPSRPGWRPPPVPSHPGPTATVREAVVAAPHLMALGAAGPLLPGKAGDGARERAETGQERRRGEAAPTDLYRWAHRVRHEIALLDKERRLPLGDWIGSSAVLWRPRQDLLSSGRFETDFVVEVDEHGTAQLRFGDGVLGRPPTPGSRFRAFYRVGNGSAGNLGARVLTQVVSEDPAVLGVINSLAAAGGVDPESLDHARLAAPQAFKVEKRAVTPQDWVDLARLEPGVADAAASLRTSGLGKSARVFVLREGGLEVDGPFRRRLTASLAPYVLLGQDLQVLGAQPVALEIVLGVGVGPGYLVSDVESALQGAFFGGTGPGLFAPTAYGLGEPVLLAAVVETARGVPGVATVEPRVFRRRDTADPSEARRSLDRGRITVAPHEVATVRNLPGSPQWGTLELVLRATSRGGTP